MSSDASFTVPFACALVLLCVLERVLNAALSLLLWASSLKRLAAQQLLVKQVETLASLGSIVLASLVRGAAYLLSWWVLFLLLVFFFSSLYVTYTDYSESWTGFVLFYNANLGPWVAQFVLIPLEILDLLARALLPLYNAALWWVKVMGVQGLLPIAIKEIQLLFQLATILSDACVDVAVSLTGFVSSFQCHGSACLVPEPRVLNAVSLMGDAKDLAVLAQAMTNAVCSLLAVPMDLALYPLLDLNFAQGVHNLLNAVAQFFLVVPQVTYERCQLAKAGTTFHTILCTPDLEPVFNFLVAGLGSLGLALDNWADVALVIVQRALTGTGPTCDTLQAAYLPSVAMNLQAFRGNATTVVGLTQWLYAVTDGYRAVYAGTSDIHAKAGYWPYAMDPSLGVAAVTYSDSDQLDASSLSGGRTAGSLQTTSMLACNCTDTTEGPEILCAILPMAGVPGAPDPYLLQVLWPDEVTPQLLGACGHFDLSVHSVRWQLSRYETQPASFGASSTKTTLPTNDCVTRGTCRGVDATIYVVPNCAASPLACVSSSCFPFCMAARASGSGNDNLVLANAARWRGGYTLLNQDCADLAASSQLNTRLKMGSSGTVSIPVPSGLASRIPVFVASIDPVCRPAARIRSVVDKPSARLSSRIRLATQPLVLTGETVFTQNDLGGGASSVHVERLTGEQQGVVSLEPWAQDLPAEPTLEVQMDEATSFSPDRVLIPFPFYETRQLAVSSRNHVFYVSNPALSSFAAYFEYCARDEATELPRLGLLIESSYSGLFVYRVSAYRQCAAYSCGHDLVARVQLEGFRQSFQSTCDQAFNATITSMEYVNEDNVALVVLETIPKEFDVTTGTAAGAHTTYQTYWLNPGSMQLSRTIWQAAVPQGSFGALCPAMQRLPRVGTLAAEVLNMGVFAFKWAIDAILYTPGMAVVWADGGACPAVGATHHHSVLVNCGDGLFSLDNFFDSYDDAASVFWHGLAVLAQFVTGSAAQDGQSVNPIADVLDGMALYGESKIDFFSASFAVMTLTKVPVADEAKNMFATVVDTAGSGGGVVQGSLYVSAATITLARFSYKALSTVALTLTKSVLQRNELTQAAIWQITWNALYDLQAEFDSTVVARSQLGCAGLRLMFGLDNPWARLVYHQCAAAAELYGNLFQLAMTIVVDVPMVVCVCKDSAGQNLQTFLARTCAPRAPLALQPLLYTISSTVSASVNNRVQSRLACDTVLNHTKAGIAASLEPWFSHQFDALEALSSSVDYALSPFDSAAGECLNYLLDPHVVVLVPQPVDYFARCSRTQLCQAKCSKEWAQFQNQTRAPRDLPYVAVDIESMFFPGELDQALFVDNVTAVAEIEGAGVCHRRVPADLAVALAEFGSAGMQVQTWCVPAAAGVSVYKASAGGYGPVALPGDVMAVQFLSDLRLVLLLRVASYNSLYLLDASMTTPLALPDLASHVPSQYTLVRIVNLWPVLGSLVVDVIVRSFQTDSTGPSSVGEIQNYQYFPNATYAPWRRTSIDLSAFAANYWFFRLASGAHLFLPKLGGLPAYSAHFALSGHDSVLGFRSGAAPVPAAEYTGMSFQYSISRYVFASNSLGSDHVFAVAPNGWNWLSQVRLAGPATAAYNSIPASTLLQTEGRCDAQSCSGCPDVATQRLCLAYGTCALMNCVGTPVNMKRPLCGIGQLLSLKGELYLLAIKGGWDIFTEILNDALRLSLTTTAGLNIEFPEEEFTGLVCTAKDASAEFFSVLTSMINSALQLGNARVNYMYDHASNVDTNSDAMLTLTMTAVTGFLNQLALFPVYSMIVSYQIYMCPINGMLAVLDPAGFRIRIQSAALSSPGDVVAGQCLTISQVTMAGYPDTASSVSRLSIAMSSTMTNVLNLALVQTIEPYLHAFDGVCTYLVGVVHSMGVMLESQYMARCNPPNYLLSDVAQCACDDMRLTIPAQPRTEGMNLWCTGTLVMLDGANNEFVVYNPYTYQQLQAMASGMDAYLACASQSYDCETPYDAQRILSLQGVTLLNVLVKCRENYVKMQWDPAAYILFNASLHYMVQYTIPAQASARPAGTCASNAAACLTAAANAGTANAACLTPYLLCAGTDLDSYWNYSRATQEGSQYTDACVVFTGPASRNLTRFAACVDGDVDVNCTLGHNVYSPDSDNSVPVAFPHKVWYHGAHQDGMVQKLYREANDLVVGALQQALAHWSSNQSSVVFAVFSAEGDVVHQILDCIFMGPYARVDYWPLPTCLTNEECLAGPYWSRDPHQGLSRSVDPASCVQGSAHSLPYTCGSPARQSLVRYFVNQMLSLSNTKDGSVIKVAVLEQLHQFLDVWGDAGRYPCVCPDGRHDPACCQDASGFFPENLNVSPLNLNNSDVLRAMDDDFQAIYEMALQNRDPWMRYMDTVAPGERAAYDWSQSKRAQDEARFTPKRVLYNYTADKAASPLQDADNTLWGVCHATLKQVFMTMPVRPDGNITFGAQRAPDGSYVPDSLSYDMLEYDGNHSGIESYVAALTHQAFLDSPLFRHYHPSHKPSPSLLCADLDPPASMAEDTLDAAWTEITLGQSLPLHAPEPVDIRDYRRFSLGSEACLCGWERLDATRCLPPPGVCSAIACDQDGAYTRGQEPDILASFQPTWDCPETDLSAAWGFLDPQANEAWLQGRTSLSPSFEELLREGRAGVKYGNIATLKGASGKASINPARRQIPLENARLYTCADPPVSPATLATHLVNDLFPMAQGVDEAGGTAYCLRYLIELARLQALTLMAENSIEAVQQALTTATWRARCGSQLQLLHLCVSLNVFFPPSGASFTPFAVQCKHFAPIATADTYTTPECLLSVRGAFYDPCRCIPCEGDPTADLNAWLPTILQQDRCRIRFDPRTMLRQAPAGYWSQGVADDLNAFWSDPASLLSDAFAEDVLDDPDAAGNTAPGQHWARAEGYMEDNAEFCDMIQDYWPEDWAFPVGYHVTVPCDQEDTAYRSFHQSFGLDWDEHGEPVMAYQHDLLRDAALVDTHFGGIGLCRASNVGMPMFETNTMRYCTSTLEGETEDYTVPLRPSQAPDAQTAWTDFRCTSSSAELPWPDHAQNQGGFDAALYSVGTVPNMPGSLSNPAGKYYPNDLDADTWAVGPVQELTQAAGWGPGCSDFGLTLCQTDLNCTGLVCRGRVCTFDGTSCATDADCPAQGDACRGVCMSPQVQCLKHSDCADDRMCTGDGQCVTPVLSFQNNLLQDDVAFRVYAKDRCADTMEEFSTVGGSYWGHTSVDVLRMHGLCSYEDWYKYQYTLANCNGGNATQAEYLNVDPTRCNYLHLDSNRNNQSRWWDANGVRPSVMYMRPSQCDRDYERLEGFRSCRPRAGSAYYVQDALLSRDYALLYDRYVKTHTGADSPRNGSVRVPIALMPDTDPSFGFLGLDNIQSEEDITPDKFQSCSQIHQCYAAPFNVSGQNVTRLYREGGQVLNYTAEWTFVCGAIGRQTASGQCTLDLDVLPLYRYLCAERLPSAEAIVSAATLDGLCTQIQLTYSPSYPNIVTNLEGLRALFFAFPQITDFDYTYLNVVEFAHQMYADMHNASRSLYPSLYFPFDFSLYEVPFDWFYQCILMNAVTSIDVTSTLPQDCLAYRDRAKHPLTSYAPVKPGGDDLLTFLKFVQAGYTIASIEEYSRQHVLDADASLVQSIARVAQQVYDSGEDESYQQCSRNLAWAVGANDIRLYNPRLRAMVEMYYDASTCSAWLEDLVSSLREYGVTQGTWVDYMTVPDPHSLMPQPRGLAGNTILQQLRANALSGFGYRTSGLMTGTSAVRPEGSVPFSPVHLDTSLPAALPDAWLPSNLDPAYQPSNPYTLTNDDSEYPFVCLYDDKLDDPLLTYWARSGAPCQDNYLVNVSRGVSTLSFCKDKYNNQVFCTKVPMYYQTEGIFTCRYISKLADSAVSRTQTVLPPCDETMPGCGKTLYQALYSLVQGYYVPVSPPPLDPQVFPWFEDAAGRHFSFNLVDILKYELNVMPDKKTTVMCSITPPQDTIDFSRCTNPNYLALKRHAAAHYLHDGAPRVPSQKMLQWDVTRAYLTAGSILAFANTNRPVNQTFMAALFDDATVCTGQTASNYRVCYSNSSGTADWTSINPWTLGFWNPYEGCDVDFNGPSQGNSEYVSAFCSPDVCKSGELWRDMPFGSECQAKYMKRSSIPGVPPYDPSAQSYTVYNLCQHAVVQDPQGCMHDQSLLGGFDGMPIAADTQTAETMAWPGLLYTVAPNMYEASAWQLPDALATSAGLFGGTNPLWAGSTSTPYGFLRVPPDELGITRIGLNVTRADNDTVSTFAIQKLPLTAAQHDETLDKLVAWDVDRWVAALGQNLQEEHDRSVAFDGVGIYDNSQLAPSCPLKRFALYDGGYAAFSPPMPSPKRASYLFGHLTGNRLAHPTMARTADGGILGSYNTSNGFCFCPNIQGVPQTQCRVVLTDGGACSLLKTIQSLRAAEPDTNRYYSHVFTPMDYKSNQNPCTMQLDWPYLNNTLRDGSQSTLSNQEGASQQYSPEESIPTKCHVLDRFRPFRYKYVSQAGGLVDPGFNTLQRGACRTGRVATLDRGSLPDQAKRCVRSGLGYGQATFRCRHGPEATLNVSVRLLPNETYARRQAGTRRRCGTCTRPPRFRTEGGSPMANESSFGRPFRRSTERVLAGDLHDILCKAGCPPLNESAWLPGQFLRNYLLTPWRLFALNATTQPSKPSLDDSARWTDHDWIYCPDAKSLRTGVGCRGHMTREQWVTGKSTTCPRMVKALSTQGGQDPLVNTSFCNLDNYTASVCQAIVTAQTMVTRANCIAAGITACLPSPFVYHPASYDTTNQVCLPCLVLYCITRKTKPQPEWQAWVQQTVQSYYTQVDKAACNLSDRTAALIAYNAKFQQGCPANAVVFFEELVLIVRTLVTEAALITARVMGMAVKLLGMLSPDKNTRAQYKASFLSDWKWIKAQAQDTSASLSDMLLDMLMDSGPLGKTLMAWFAKTCSTVNTIYAWLMNVWCNFVETHMIRLMTSLKTAIGMIATGFDFLQDFADEIFQVLAGLALLALLVLHVVA